MPKNGFMSLFVQEGESDKDPKHVPAPTPAVEIAPNVAPSSLVNADLIYQAAGITTPPERSIFQVERLRSVQPEKMLQADKKTTVLGTMSVLNLTAEEVVADAAKRKQALEKARVLMSEEVTTAVSVNEDRIAEMTAQIEALKKENQDKQIAQEEQATLIDKEVKHIEELVAFIS